MVYEGHKEKEKGPLQGPLVGFTGEQIIKNKDCRQPIDA